MADESSLRVTRLETLLETGTTESLPMRECLKKVEVNEAPYSSNSVRLKDKSFLSPRLEVKEILGAARSLGGNLTGVGLTDKTTKFGMQELDLHMVEPSYQEVENLEMVTLKQSGPTRLLGAKGTNLLILTTEDSGFLGRGLETKHIDDARAYLEQQNLRYTETPVDQYHLDGPAIYIRSIAFVIDES
jgi:hypothetical protein